MILCIYGCSSTKYLAEGEQLLVSQKIKGNKNVDELELEAYFKQKPNHTLFPVTYFSHYVHFYQWGLKRYNPEKEEQKRAKIEQHYDQKLKKNHKKRKKKKIQNRQFKKLGKQDKIINEGNYWMRQGEPLAVFNEGAARESARQMNNYLRNKGYFNNEVEYEVISKKRKVKVNYIVKEGKPYIIDSVVYKTNDEGITWLLWNHWDERKLVKGINYDQSVLIAERDFMEEVLRNNGYFEFSKQYIDFAVDTSYLGNRRVLVEVIINKPARRGYHKVFQVDSVIFTTDASTQVYDNLKRRHAVYKGITYTYFEDHFSKKVLNKKTLIHPGDYYSKSNTLETQRQLSYLDMFKFININYDTTGGKFIANIFASPLKKFSTSNEIGVNVVQNYPGPFYNLNLKNRNPFGGLEILDFNARVGVAGVVAPDNSQRNIENAYQSVEMGINGSIIFPRFIAPFGKWILERTDINPRTRWLLGFNSARNPSFSRNTLRTLMLYTWQGRNNTLFSLSPLDVNIINSSTSPAYKPILDELKARGNTFYRNFEPSFISSISFSPTFNFGNYGSRNKEASYLKLHFESGGTFLNFGTPKALADLGLQTFQFVKVMSDYRLHRPLSPLIQMAGRLNIGIAFPYGENKTLPYEKFFFSGGSNSNRGWAPRRLGLGSYYTNSVTNRQGEQVEDKTNYGYFKYTIEQPGDLMLESSIEFRRHLIGNLHTASFIDVGNVWLVHKDEHRPGANFEFNRFWKEIAIGSGVGFRLDLSYLLVRLDLGWKVYDPARPASERWIGQKFSLATELRHTVYNVGIGYPF